MEEIKFEKFKLENGTFWAWWHSIKPGNVGKELAILFAADITIQVTGTFDGASLSIEGSNDGENWFQLHTYPEKPAFFISAGLRKIVESPVYIRPVMAMNSSAESNLIVLISCKGSAP